MATVKALIKNDKVNKRGLCTVYIRYGHQQASTDISTGLQVDPKAWNITKELVNATSGIKATKANEELIKSLKRSDLIANQKIELAKARLMEIARHLQLEQTEPEVRLVKQKFLELEKPKVPDNAKESLTSLYQKFIDTSSKSDATKANYSTALYHLKLYQKKRKKELEVKDINLKLYDDLMSFLYQEIEKPDKTKGLSDNSVGTTIKNLKVFLSYLQKRGYSIPNIHADLRAPKVDIPIVFLTEEEIDRLESYPMTSERLEKVRDVFVFNCYTGLRYSDLSRLQKYHIVDGVIQMRAYKNQKDLYVPLTQKSERILQQYNYELPMIAEQNYNDYIKEACSIAGINQEVDIINTVSGNKTYTTIPKWKAITSHIAVKTFISLCGKKGISPKIVSEITGKSVQVILKHYYGIDKDTIKEQMQRAFK
jgi:site-specific recombinase XerD